MATSAQPAPRLPGSGNVSPPKQPTDILPTLFGEGYGTYAVQSRNFYTSILLHTVALALLLYVTHQVVTHRAQIAQALGPVVEIGAYIPMPASAKQAGGGGGGGDRDKLEACKGAPAKFTMQRDTPTNVAIHSPT